MSGSVFTFTRQITVEGRPLLQTVTVYAQDASAARRVLAKDLRSLRETTKGPDPALEPSPAWQVSEVALEAPRVLSFVVA